MRHDSHKLEKLLNAMLSLCPDVYGLVLNDDGWISIKELHGAIVHEGDFGYVTPAFLTQFFLMNSSQYEVNDRMVRHRDGCLVSSLPVESPPDILYVAVSSKGYDAVRKNGLKGVSGRVVLFVSAELAVSVVKRRFPSHVLLQIKTDTAMRMGCRFCLYGESIYLSSQIPSNAIVFPLLSTANKRDGRVLNRGAVRSAEKGKTSGRAKEASGFFLSISSSADFELVRRRNMSDDRRDSNWKIARKNSRRRDGF